MRIAITDIKDYNEAILRFEWLDLENCSTADEIGEFISAFLAKRSKETNELHEEWFVTDYEEFVDLGEYPSVEELAKAAQLTKEYGWEAVSAYHGHNGSFDGLEDAYSGIYKSEEDFAYEIAHECYSESQLGELEQYIDWEKYARDLFIGDYFSEEVDTGVAVFKRL
jgi:antirestriction protein